MAKRDTREKLVEAAIRLFSEKGYNGTGVDEIGAAAGIRGPNLYKYFQSKEALLSEIMRVEEERYQAGMAMDSREAEEILTGSGLKAFSLRQIAFTLNREDIRRMRRLLTIEQYRSPLFASYATRYQVTNLREMYAGIFRRLMAAGVMRAADPELLALQYIAPVTLLIQLRDREPERGAEVLEAIEKHLDAFIAVWCGPK